MFDPSKLIDAPLWFRGLAVVWIIFTCTMAALALFFGKPASKPGSTSGVAAAGNNSPAIQAGNNSPVTVNYGAAATARPIVTATHITTEGSIRAGAPIIVTVTLTNGGSGPAFRLQAPMFAETVARGSNPTYSYDRITDRSTGTLAPSAVALCRLSPTRASDGEPGALTEENYRKLVSKETVIFVHGHVTYEGASGAQHWTDFSSYLTLSNGQPLWNISADHNDMDRN